MGRQNKPFHYHKKAHGKIKARGGLPAKTKFIYREDGRVVRVNNLILIVDESTRYENHVGRVVHVGPLAMKVEIKVEDSIHVFQVYSIMQYVRYHGQDDNNDEVMPEPDATVQVLIADRERKMIDLSLSMAAEANGDMQAFEEILEATMVYLQEKGSAQLTRGDPGRKIKNGVGKRKPTTAVRYPKQEEDDDDDSYVQDGLINVD